MMKKKSERLITGMQALRRKGYSYKEIAKTFDISPVTSFKYCSEVELEEKGRLRLEKKIKRKRESFAEKYAKLKQVRLNREFCVAKARIIGHCIFDGSVSERTMKYSNSSPVLFNQFIKDVHNVYSIDPDRIESVDGKNKKKYVVWYCYTTLCKDLYVYAPTYSTASSECIIPEKIMSASGEIVAKFLRTFWEDEGCVTVGGDVIGRIKSRKVRNQLLSLHSRLGIKCSSYSCSDGLHGIYVKRSADNLRRFDEEVGFRHSIIVRGENVGVKKRQLFLKIIEQKYS